MKLYVCWGTFPVPWPRRSGSWRPGAHPCKKAFDALSAAGHSPEMVKTFHAKAAAGRYRRDGADHAHQGSRQAVSAGLAE
jgi:hypothetical protein